MILTLLTNVVIAISILAAAWFGGGKVSAFIKTFDKLDVTLRSFLGGLAKYFILAIAIVTVLNQFGVQTASLIAVLGAAGLAIGLALQGTLSNVAAGVMLLILRPFNVGDFIKYNDHMGTVKALGLFGTELATLDNVFVFAPNSTIWNSDIYNFSRNPERRQDIIFSISYSDDIGKAFGVIDKTIAKDERVMKEGERAPVIAVHSLAASSVDIMARVWTNDDHYYAKLDITKAVKEALDKGGFTIPFPTQTIEYADPAAAPKGSCEEDTREKVCGESKKAA